MSGKATDQQQAAADEQSEDQGTESVQSSDQAGDSDAGVEESEESDGNEETSEDDAVELIGQKDFDRLKSDPEALRKELNRAATKKFQKLAATQKKLEPYAGFITELESDPVAAVTAVARHLGIKIEEGSTSTEAKTAKTMEDLGTRITAAVKNRLGPDYEDISEGIGAAIHDALNLAVPELTKGFKEQVDGIIQDSALREANAAIMAFEKKYPDWKQYEDEMTALSEKMTPGKGMTEAEYLENLYLLASRDRSTGEGVKKIVSKMQKSAKAAERDSTSMSEKVVSKTPAKPPTFSEAYAAAKRGERFE